MLNIPTLPISYADASKILAGLQGPVVTGSWRGGLPLTYHWGGTGAVRVHLAVKSDWSLKPIYDVIATLPGTSIPTIGSSAATIMTAGCSARPTR